MSICVLGGDGFIGRNLVKDLGAQGFGRKDLDLLDSDAVDLFFENNSFEIVIHCGVIGGSRLRQDGDDVFMKNIKMFENVARHAEKFKRLIWFSSGAAVAARETPYGYSKYICEKLARLIPNCQVFRIYGCYGTDEPSTRFISTCLREPVHIEKDILFDFFWVGDIHKVINNFITCDGKVRDLVYKTKLKLSDIAILNNAKIASIKSNEGQSYIGEFTAEIGIEDRLPIMHP